MENNFDPTQMLGAISETVNTAYTSYGQLHFAPGCRICLFEGPTDYPYYNHRISAVCDTYQYVVCYGKKNVYKMYGLIHNRDSRKYKLGYFTDHDFDADNTNPDIYETKTYSIENYYCSRDAFEKYLLHHVKLRYNEDRVDLDRALHFYDQQMDEFHNVTSLFNNYYAAIKLVERTPPYPQHSIECGNTFPSELADITIEAKSVTENYTLEKLNQSYASSITQGEIDAQDAVLNSNPSALYRGKYEIQMMKLIMGELLGQLTPKSKVKKANRIIQRTKPPLGIKKIIEDDKFMIDLSPYADTEQQLIAYLQRLK